MTTRVIITSWANRKQTHHEAVENNRRATSSFLCLQMTLAELVMYGLICELYHHSDINTQRCLAWVLSAGWCWLCAWEWRTTPPRTVDCWPSCFVNACVSTSTVWLVTPVGVVRCLKTARRRSWRSECVPAVWCVLWPRAVRVEWTRLLVPVICPALQLTMMTTGKTSFYCCRAEVFVNLHSNVSLR